ncbi:hypothetical protein GPK34_00730 [Secundilactobacillus kimchicus]|uniref:hypothetical protein n=1 Tax=Secundilactobacillus kimchicus TaxID=528209 RepID=UPI001C032FB6|nr:hypothetical protein [Secundilactobacillus kimchicus]MBT9670563.1 hypothetical protein [Secundilactobacillus kimchicus]
MDLALESINYFLHLQFDSDRHLVLNDECKQALEKIKGVDTSASHAAVSIRYQEVPYAQVTTITAPDTSLMHQIKDTDIEAKYPLIFELMRLCIYECWIVTYVVTEDGEYLTELTLKDIKRTRHNLRYLADWCGHYRAYRFLVEYLRDLDLAEGYMENQISLILKTSDLRYEFDDR